jgi:hypothetical protein
MRVSGRPRRRRLIAVNRESLRALLTHVVRDRFAGIASDAALVAKIPQETFSALLRGDRQHVREKTYRALMDFAGARSDAMERCFFSSVAIGLLALEEQANEERWKGYLDRCVPIDPAARGEEQRRRVEAFNALLRHVQQNYVGYCRSFENRVRALGHGPAQIRAAYFRVLEHLLPADSSGGLGRTWEELPPDELRQFLEAGFQRELIFLRRSPDNSRAQQRAEGVISLRPVLALALRRRPRLKPIPRMMRSAWGSEECALDMESLWNAHLRSQVGSGK